MRIAIVGAGLAGLATGAAFSRAGHDVQVFEQADGLRASGLAINLWSNATSLLPAFGIPAGRIPGEPFYRMVWRAGGREVTSMELPACGLPHVNVERAELLNALAAALPADAITYGTRCTDVARPGPRPRPGRRRGRGQLGAACRGDPPATQAVDMDRLASERHRRPSRGPRGRGRDRDQGGALRRDLAAFRGTAHLVRRAAGTQPRWRQPAAPGPQRRRGPCPADARPSHVGTGRAGIHRVARQGPVAKPDAAPRQRRAGRRRRARHAAHARPGRLPVPGRRRRPRLGGRRRGHAGPVRSAATRRHASPACAGSPRWPGPEPSADGPTRPAGPCRPR